MRPPYCIFDHERLCQTLFERSGAGFLRARVQGLDGNTVLTSAGPVTGRVLIDATGWPAALAVARRPELAERKRLTVGIEAELPGRAEGIHFTFDETLVRRGYAWLFPAGDTLRVGIGAYESAPALTDALARFLDRLGYVGKPHRGGMIPWFDRPPTVDNLFLVGDAAGQCVPLTAEGIRFALHFGEMAGTLARQALDGERTLAAALATYRQQVRPHRRRTALMRFAQGFVGVLPNRAIHHIAHALTLPPIETRFMRRYAAWSA